MSEEKRMSANDFRSKIHEVIRDLKIADKRNWKTVCEKAIADMRGISFESTLSYAQALAGEATAKNKCMALQKEVERLASELIIKSKEETGCAVGPWCKGCIHVAVEAASYMAHIVDTTYESEFSNTFRVTDEVGRVMYCRKHIHDICPEFEKYGGNT